MDTDEIPFQPNTFLLLLTPERFRSEAPLLAFIRDHPCLRAVALSNPRKRVYPWLML